MTAVGADKVAQICAETGENYKLRRGDVCVNMTRYVYDVLHVLWLEFVQSKNKCKDSCRPVLIYFQHNICEDNV